MKDVIIKPDGPNTLLLDKHADYIASYGSKNDDYVSTKLNLYYMHVISHIYYLQDIQVQACAWAYACSVYK